MIREHHSLEIIRLRTSSHERSELASTLQRATAEGPSEGSFQVYVHHNIATDLCVLIHLDAEQVPSGLSELGLRLASSLGEFGLVEHTTWSRVGV